MALKSALEKIKALLLTDSGDFLRTSDTMFTVISYTKMDALDLMCAAYHNQRPEFSDVVKAILVEDGEFPRLFANILALTIRISLPEFAAALLP